MQKSEKSSEKDVPLLLMHRDGTLLNAFIVQCRSFGFWFQLCEFDNKIMISILARLERVNKNLDVVLKEVSTFSWSCLTWVLFSFWSGGSTWNIDIEFR